MRCNITRWCIQHFSHSGRTYNIRACTNKTHPIPRPDGWAIGVSIVMILVKIDWVIMDHTLLCQAIPPYCSNGKTSYSKHCKLMKYQLGMLSSIFFYHNRTKKNNVVTWYGQPDILRGQGTVLTCGGHCSCWTPSGCLIFAQPFVQAQIKENIKASSHCPLLGEVTADWWIPLTKDQ